MYAVNSTFLDTPLLLLAAYSHPSSQNWLHPASPSWVPQGHLQNDGSVLVSELCSWVLVELSCTDVERSRESCKLAKAAFYTSYFVLELYFQPFVRN